MRRAPGSAGGAKTVRTRLSEQCGEEFTRPFREVTNTCNSYWREREAIVERDEVGARKNALMKIRTFKPAGRRGRPA